jgi:hypothetical protein
MTDREELPSLNVLPIDDIQPHRHDRHCMCNPKVKVYDHALLVTHNSFDGREDKELQNDTKSKTTC